MQNEQPEPVKCRFVGFVFVAVLLLVLTRASVVAQQPFVTDDTDTTPRHHLHFEFSNEYDVLQRASFPNLKQNTADFELDYGLFERVEIGAEVPIITLLNSPDGVPIRVTGNGDANFSFKYNFLTERKESRWPAMTISMNVELPTGSVKRQLGSGLADYYLNGVIQKHLSTKTILRVNGGLLLSGNETTGVEGIKTRGTVFTGGGSLVRQFTPKLDLGVELVGAETRNFELSKGQLQTMVGGNYSLRRNMTFDFGIVAGRFAASPRLGAQLGISIDF